MLKYHWNIGTKLPGKPNGNATPILKKTLKVLTVLANNDMYSILKETITDWW
jgi:hypothetical protein